MNSPSSGQHTAHQRECVLIQPSKSAAIFRSTV
jgi:hypothetical protein